MLVFVLDTTAVTDYGLRRKLGVESLSSVVSRVTELMRVAVLRHRARFYVTPQVMEELKRFLQNNGVGEEDARRLLAWLTVKSPSLMEVRIPAAVMASYVGEVQERLTRGLRVAEEAVRKASKAGENDLGSLIRELREKYRDATRRGMLDSTADFNTAMLAREVGGIMVTSDSGLRKLCETLGIVVVSPDHFIDMLTELASTPPRQARETQ